MVVNDMRLNAFVVDSRRIFLNAGLILKLQSADALQAVMAHEIAHIANNHFARRSLNAQTARTATGLGILLGVVAGAATGNAELGVGAALGGAGAAQRSFLAHTRAEEASADKSGMRYLARAGIDPAAMGDVLDLFAGQEALNVSRRDPYAQSHPLTRDRIRAVDQLASKIKPRETDQTTADYWFARAKGKLSAYLRSPGYTLNKTGQSDTSDAAYISRAMAYFKTPDLAAARREMALLLERNPSDAYLHELSGWIEIESGQVAPAIAAYEEAAALAPREPLILGGLGRALLAANTTTTDQQALEVLEKARARDPFDSRMLRDLSLAYARAGKDGMASVTTAERYALRGDLRNAGFHAGRAVALLPTGSPGWARAQDIVQAARQADSQRR